MSSSIDATTPESGSATTASVRTNFSAAKTEIEALQTDKFDKTITANNVLVGNDNGASQAAQELDATAVRTILNVADGANNYSHPNHTGDVTSTGDGATVIAANAVTTAKILDDNVTYAKIQNVVADDRILGNVAGAGGIVAELDASTVRTMLNVADGSNNYSHPNHTGDVTSTGDGATVIADEAVTLAKMAHMATASFLGRNTAATGDVEVLSAATARSVLGIEAGATADQTDAEIETAYNNQVAQVSQAEAEAGSVTSDRRWTPQRVKQAINANDAASVDGTSIWTGTQAAYDALGAWDANTLYFTT